jgi:hypothetical protein
MLVEHLSRAQDGRFLGVRISTLNPHLIFPSDFLALSHRKTFSISFTHSRGKGRGAEIAYQYTNSGVEPFPPHAHGFLYYHSDPTLSQQAGGVRLRTTPDSAVSSFHHGHDLRLPSGMPWQIGIPQIATTQKFSCLREQLLHERMVSNALMSRCHTIFANRRNIHPELTVWGLQHPFLVNFGTSLCLTMVGPTAAHETELHPYTEWIPEIPGTRPRQLSRPFIGTYTHIFTPRASSRSRLNCH